MNFHLLVDADGDVFGGVGSSAVASCPETAGAKPKAKSPLDVTCEGAFLYDVPAMKAEFERTVEVDRTVARSAAVPRPTALRQAGAAVRRQADAAAET